MAGASDGDGFALRCYAVALVDVINTIGEPYTTITTVCLNRVYCLARVAGLYALGGNLEACFVGDFLTLFKGQAVIVGKFENRANVNHYVLPSFPLCIYYTILFAISQYLFEKFFMNFCERRPGTERD